MIGLCCERALWNRLYSAKETCKIDYILQKRWPRQKSLLVSHKWHCNTLQHTATHCNTLQRHGDSMSDMVTPCQNCDISHKWHGNHELLRIGVASLMSGIGGCFVTKHASYSYASCCNTLQHTATHCNTLQSRLSYSDEIDVTYVCDILESRACHRWDAVTYSTL